MNFIYFKEGHKGDTALEQLNTMMDIINEKQYKARSEDDRKKMIDWLADELRYKVQDLKSPETEFDRWVVVDKQEGGAVFCEGIFKDYLTALGRAVDRIQEFHESYRDEGDEFSCSDLMELEGDGGYFFKVRFKSASWDHALEEYYYILDGREHTEGGVW